MTKQATFNHVARHLLRQGRRAVDSCDSCVLHAHSGLRCAAGVLVTRRDYDPELELDSAVKAGGMTPLCDYLDSKGHDLGLVEDLQLVHDTFNPSQWVKALRGVATTHKLSHAAIDERLASDSRKGGGA